MRCRLLLVSVLLLSSATAADRAPADASGRSAPPTAEPAFELEQSKQDRIWDMEHVAFQVESYVGASLRSALERRDAKALAGFFRKGYRGRWLDDSDPAVRRVGPVRELRLVRGAVASRALDARKTATVLLETLKPFASFRRLKLNVLHVAPLGPGVYDAELRLLAIGTDREGLPIETIVRFDAELRYEDREEVQAGRIIASLDEKDRVSRRSDRWLMEEVTEQAGLAGLPLADNWELPVPEMRLQRFQVAVEDYDRDGFFDIAIATREGRPLLLRSIAGKRFEDVASIVGLKPAPGAPAERPDNAMLAWIDYDGNGYPDLLLGTRLYHNDGGRRFVDVSRSSGLSFDRVPFGAAVADYDADGKLDLYIAYQKGYAPRPPGKRPWVGDPHAGAENHLWRNMGGGRFKNVTVPAAAGGGRNQTFAAVAFHNDDDPFPDLYLANDFGQNVLLRNRGDGAFQDVTLATGTGDFSTSMGVAAGDLDNDGSNELYVANMYSKMGRRIIAHLEESDYPTGLFPMIQGSLAGNRLYRTTPQGRYEETSDELGINAVGWAHAPAMTDLDGDGWLDLYATAGFNSVDRTKPDG